jgi:peptidoglycan/xylan/chitin deacetylase (PgdA/CDA1 family)
MCHGGGANWKLKAYYSLRPLIPRELQLLVRKSYKAKQEVRTFPAWPIEPAIVDTVRKALVAAAESDRNGGVHRISPWPGGKKFAFVITHDVEWDAGLRIAPELVSIEKQFGFVSSFNIVPERYPIDWQIVGQLREAGCEIGVHGLKHDGKLFLSRRVFRKRLVRIHEYAKKWGAVGFRSPATLRNTEWMPELQFEYDSSFFDTDPYEPQPGGCCTIWPYFIGSLLELPMTMPQDHTLFEILGHKDIDLWIRKSDWIAEQGGMVLINVHPDYMNSPERLKLYEEFLRHMKGKQGMWHGLPREVARWWRDRTESTLVRKNDTFVVEGPAAGTASVLKTRLENGMLVDTIAV